MLISPDLSPTPPSLDTQRIREVLDRAGLSHEKIEDQITRCEVEMQRLWQEELERIRNKDTNPSSSFNPTIIREEDAESNYQVRIDITGRCSEPLNSLARDIQNFMIQRGYIRTATALSSHSLEPYDGLSWDEPVLITVNETPN